jgi:lipopolysaccharide transport system permease protein
MQVQDSHTQNEEDWSMTIRPKRNLLDINLKELWQYRDLIVLFVHRDFIARFKQTILGPFWFVLGPLLSTVIYTFVFNKIAKIPTDNVSPILFYLSGLVGWQYFSACLNGTSNTFTANAGIFGKVYFPRLVTPISTVISNLILFVIQFGLLLFIMTIYYFKGAQFVISWTVLLIPFYLILLAMIGLGVGIIISSLTTKYRDLTNLMGFGVQLWMYATPIIYPISMVPDNFKVLVMLNPIAPIIEAFKFSMLGAGSFSLPGLLYSLIFAVVFLIAGVILFNKVEQNFMDTV